MKKYIKTLLISLFLSFSWTIYIHARSGIRIKTDETHHTHAAEVLLRTNRLSDVYLAGNSYEIILSIILMIGDLGILSYDWLSPVISSIIFIGLVTIIMSIAKLAGRSLHWWSPLLFVSIFLAVPEVLSGFREASHKAFTYLSVIILLYSFIQVISESNRINKQRSFVLLLLSTLSTLSLTYIWGSIFISSLILAWATLYVTGLKSAIHRSIAGAATIVSSLAFVLYSVGIGYRSLIEHLIFMIEGSSRLISGSSQNGDVGTSTFISEIFSYPSLELFGIEISNWFIYSTGLFTTIVICGLVGVMSIYAILNRQNSWQDNHILALVCLSVFITYSALLAAVIVTGNTVVAKRTVDWPILVAAIVWIVIIAGDQPIGIKLDYNHQKLVSIIIIGVLILSIPLAAERISPTNPNSPYNPHLSLSSENKIDFSVEYDISESVIFHNVPERDRYLILERRYHNVDGCSIQQSKIYHNEDECTGTLSIK